MAWWLRDRVQQEEGAEFDMAGALAEISGGLGFEGGDEGGDDGGEIDTGSSTSGDSNDDSGAGSGADGEEGKAPKEGVPANAAKPGEETAPQVKPETTAEAPPRTWKPEAAAKWSELPPVVKEEIAKREEEMFKGIEQYKLDAGFGKTIQRVLDPYVPVMQQYGINPIQQIGDLMKAHHTLALGTPQAKLGMVQWLAKEYKIDLAGLGAPAAEPAYTDPAVQGLQKKVEELESHQAAVRAAEEKRIYDASFKEVTDFKNDPKNVYFNELAGDITQLIKSGQCRTVQEAYSQAIWLNPVTRDKEIARQTAEREKSQREAEAAKAAEAKKATAANLRTTVKKGSAAAPVGTMDETLGKAYDEIMSRS